MASYNLPAPRRITGSSLPLPSSFAADANAEPGVEVQVETLTAEPVMDMFRKATVATAKGLPTSNDGFGQIPLDEVPAPGIVLPGGLNMYYLDIAPNSEGNMHRTTSTDYLVVLKGALSLITPASPFTVVDGVASYEAGDIQETVVTSGEVIAQRGMMHALSNRTNEWVRVMGIVLGSEPNKVPVGTEGASAATKVLADAWLAPAPVKKV